MSKIEIIFRSIVYAFALALLCGCCFEIGRRISLRESAPIIKLLEEEVEYLQFALKENDRVILGYHEKFTMHENEKEKIRHGKNSQD